MSSQLLALGQCQELQISNNDELEQHYATKRKVSSPIEVSECSRGSLKASKTKSAQNSYSYDIFDCSKVFFSTERINLPREKVVIPETVHSSPSHGFARNEEKEILDEINIKKFDEEEEQPGFLSASKVSKVYLEKIVGNTRPPEYNS